MMRVSTWRRRAVGSRVVRFVVVDLIVFSSVQSRFHLLSTRSPNDISNLPNTPRKPLIETSNNDASVRVTHSHSQSRIIETGNPHDAERTIQSGNKGGTEIEEECAEGIGNG